MRTAWHIHTELRARHQLSSLNSEALPQGKQVIVCIRKFKPWIDIDLSQPDQSSVMDTTIQEHAGCSNQMQVIKGKIYSWLGIVYTLAQVPKMVLTPLQLVLAANASYFNW